MKYCLGAVVVVLVSAAADPVPAVLPSELFPAAPNSSLNLECLAQHCLVEVGECVADKDCRDGALCAKKCLDNWNQDTTSEKVHVQNCTNICAFSYEGAVYKKFMDCMGDHQCMSFPSIPSQCKAPGNITLLKKLSVKDLEGIWWVVKGLHPVYDCYPCQHLSFTPINASIWSYKPKYQVYLTNGSLALADQEFFLPNTTSGDSISFHYHDVGLSHYETWWLFDAADDNSYVLLYYCGHTLQWYYDGSLIMARESSLSDDDYTSIAKSYSQALGIKLSDLCSTSTKQCPD